MPIHISAATSSTRDLILRSPPARTHPLPDRFVPFVTPPFLFSTRSYPDLHHSNEGAIAPPSQLSPRFLRARPLGFPRVQALRVIASTPAYHSRHGVLGSIRQYARGNRWPGLGAQVSLRSSPQASHGPQLTELIAQAARRDRSCSGPQQQRRCRASRADHAAGGESSRRAGIRVRSRC